MTDTIDGTLESPALPVNEEGAIVVHSGGGSQNVVGYLPAGYYPMDTESKGLVLRLPPAGSEQTTFTPAGTGAVTTNVQAKLRGFVSASDFGAVGDGTADDTAEFDLIETAYTGVDVNLEGKTYLVTSTPTKNNYQNGFFKFSGATRPVDSAFETPATRFHTYGGQLRKLREALADPLQQIVGICLIGDSITWGRALPENAVFAPRNGTLSDPRDSFASPSWANELKRYIGANYAFGASPILSNWAAAPSGEAIAEYRITRLLYPREAPFALTVSGSNQTSAEVATSASPSGFQFQINDYDITRVAYQEISFPFTGTEFTLIYACVDADAASYELFVDGVSQGVFETSSAGGGVNGTNNNRRTHTFGYVRNKTIQIRSNNTGLTGNRRLRVNGIEVTKRIVITNQGIIGATTKSYDLYNLSGSFSVPTAVTAQDSFIIMQLGTNDRNRSTAVPAGVQGFERHLTVIMNRLSPLGDVILMCACPAQNESTATYSFTMQDVRDTLIREAKSRSIDIIDNYSIFIGTNFSTFTADGLHPNARGMLRIAKNIVTALESA